MGKWPNCEKLSCHRSPDLANNTLYIQVNGESQEVPDGFSLEDLVQRLSLPATRIAIELNKNVARRAEWAGTILAEGDRVEIVHFVGGGAVKGASHTDMPLVNKSH
jgi:sulfur carrier protein